MVRERVVAKFDSWGEVGPFLIVWVVREGRRRKRRRRGARLSFLALVSPLLSFVAQAASLGHVCTLWGGGSE